MSKPVAASTKLVKLQVKYAARVKELEGRLASLNNALLLADAKGNKEQSKQLSNLRVKMCESIAAYREVLGDLL